MIAAQLSGNSGFIGADSSEAYKISGAFHNGPLSAIRYVGIVGLFLFMFMSIAIALKAWRIIHRSMDTPYRPLAFFTIPMLFSPFVYVFIFGAYETDLPIAISQIATLKLLSRSLDDYEATLPVVAPEPTTEEEQPVSLAGRFS